MLAITSRYYRWLLSMKTFMYVLRQPYCEVPSWLVKNFSWSVFNTIQLSVSRCCYLEKVIPFLVRSVCILSLMAVCHTELSHTVTSFLLLLHLHIASLLKIVRALSHKPCQQHARLYGVKTGKTAIWSIASSLRQTELENTTLCCVQNTRIKIQLPRPCPTFRTSDIVIWKSYPNRILHLRSSSL
jgi:hypothetical protein